MLAWFLRNANLLTLQGVVVLAVVEFFPNASANLKVKVRRHRHIAGIEQAVDVTPQQEPVTCLVFTTITIRPDMRSFESRQGPLLRDSAAPMVDVCP